MSICLFGLMALSFIADGVSSEFIPSGITRRTGGYRPIRAEMDQELDVIKKQPEGLVAPKVGWIEINDKKWAFILDEPEDADARLFVDTNGDLDLTNDPAAKWEVKKAGEFVQFMGEGEVDLGSNQIGKLGMYRFDPKDPRRAQLKNTLMFYMDYGYEYTIPLDGSKFTCSVAGQISKDQSLWIDRDHNKRPSQRFEMAKVGEPFNFTGTTYLLDVKDGELVLEQAKEAIDMLPMPPNLEIGQPSLTFTAKTMSGEEVSFPKSYAGKIVMLDFWATWCGPCIGEIPNMKQAYEDWHDKGFEILGVSFDDDGMEEKLKEFLTEKELPWPQIYEGKGWDVSIGQQHDVSGIPFVLLVDGDSGKILANAAQLRGKKLSEFIGKALEEKAAASK
jgi:thiol-disulfide isomerase/thioredoxin